MYMYMTTCTCTFSGILSHGCACIHVGKYTCTHVHVGMYMYTCSHVHVHVVMYMYTCIGGTCTRVWVVHVHWCNIDGNLISDAPIPNN